MSSRNVPVCRKQCSSIIVPGQGERKPLASVSSGRPPMPTLCSSQKPLERSMKSEKRKPGGEDQRQHHGLKSNKRACEGPGTRAAHYQHAGRGAGERKPRKIKLGEFHILAKCSLNNLSHILRPDSHFFPTWVLIREQRPNQT